MKGTINQINQGLRVKTNLKAGGVIIHDVGGSNHNQTLVREAKPLRVKTNIKAGAKHKLADDNHSQTLVRG
jgi:hypothetical protein